MLTLSFTHKGIFEILDTCSKNEMAVNVVTNATFLTEDIIPKLKQYKRLVVIVSLDGNEEIHDFIRGKGIFLKVDKALSLLKRNGIPTEVTFTINAKNISVYREVVEYCTDREIPCNFNLFKPFKPEHQILVPDPAEVFDITVELLKLRRDKGYKIGLSNAAVVSYIMGIPPRNECRATRSGMVINVKGEMLTCPSLTAAGYYKGVELPCFDENFIETWNSHPNFVNFRLNGLRECQARAFIYNGGVNADDPYGITAFQKHWSYKKS